MEFSEPPIKIRLNKKCGAMVPSYMYLGNSKSYNKSILNISIFLIKKPQELCQNCLKNVSSKFHMECKDKTIKI
jgi:hypothetical protein